MGVGQVIGNRCIFMDFSRTKNTTHLRSPWALNLTDTHMLVVESLRAKRRRRGATATRVAVHPPSATAAGYLWYAEMLGKPLATQKSWHFHHFPIRKYMKIPCPPTKLDPENRYSLECNFPTLKLAGSMLVGGMEVWFGPKDDPECGDFRICHGPGLADPRERKRRVVGTCGEKRPCVLRWACPRGGWLGRPCQEVTGRIWDKQTWHVLFQHARLYV